MPMPSSSTIASPVVAPVSVTAAVALNACAVATETIGDEVSTPVHDDAPQMAFVDAAKVTAIVRFPLGGLTSRHISVRVPRSGLPVPVCETPPTRARPTLLPFTVMPLTAAPGAVADALCAVATWISRSFACALTALSVKLQLVTPFVVMLGLLVTLSSATTLGVCVAVGVAVLVAVFVGVFVRVGVAVAVAVLVAVFVAVFVGVFVAVGTGVFV